MFLSNEAVTWSISTLRENCHPFVGITFLASKKAELPVDEVTDIKLDSVTKEHLDYYHKLDPTSDYFFQPFKSNKNIYWVTPTYPSS